ncbi:MAG: DegV family protein [Eubacteriales bacterium]|nr:DegV family protein [Eubacteriales bacterium]
MENYAIFTDSTGDLTPEQAEKHQITVLPMGFCVGERSYRHYPDEREMSMREFYALLRMGMPASTNAVSPALWEDAFDKALSAGQDVLAITFSSALSCTWANAESAARIVRERYPERRVEVIDSLCASMGQGMLCLMADSMRMRNVPLEDAVSQLNLNKLHVSHWFTVADLGHLRRGGRISRTTALVGTALGVKPMLHVDNEGRLVGVDKARGRRRAIAGLVERMAETIVDPEKQTAYITHADCQPDAEYLAELIRQRIPVQEVVIQYVGPIAGAHAGPSTLALFFIGKER